MQEIDRSQNNNPSGKPDVPPVEPGRPDDPGKPPGVPPVETPRRRVKPGRPFGL